MNHNEQTRLEVMAQELEGLKTDVSEMKAVLKDVHTLLAGNPIDRNSGGLLSDFKRMKDELDEIREQLRKYKAYFYALVTLISAGAAKAIFEMFQK